MLSFSPLTLSFNSMNTVYHVRVLKVQGRIDMSQVFQTKLPVSYVKAFLVVRFHLSVATSV